MIEVTGRPQRSKKMENRYREGLQNICKNARDAERILIASARAEEDNECADVMYAMAKAYGIVAGWVIDEIRDADAEVRDGDEGND